MVDIYCAAPFRHIALNQTTDRYRPCCMWHHDHPTPVTVADDDPMNHQWMQQLRDHMLQGTAQEGCIKCYDSESSRGTSLRLWFNEIYGRVTDTQLTSMEMNFGNLCNLKCRMCGSWGSSRWIADEFKLGLTPQPLVRRKLDDMQINLANLDQIKLIGGEPSLEQPAIAEILSRIKQTRGSLSHLSIEIITNGLIPFSDQILSWLKECRNVLLEISIDGFGTHNDYQRSGSNWADVSRNAKFYHSFVSTSWITAVASCPGIFTINSIPDLVDWMIAEMPGAMHVVQPIIDPKPQAIRNLPDSYKWLIRQKISAWKPAPGSYYDQSKIENLCQNLQWHLDLPNNCDISSVRSHVNQLDLLRDEHLSEQNPELFAHLFG